MVCYIRFYRPTSPVYPTVRGLLAPFDAGLRRLRPDLKALLVSGQIDADPKDMARDPRTSFLYKPVAPDTLSTELRRLLDSAPDSV